MDREDSFLEILKATAKIQDSIAIILEAKANEAEKSRNWMCRNVLDSAYSDDALQLKEPNQFHEQIIEAIDGITKVEAALATNLKILLNQGEEGASQDDFGDSFGDGFKFEDEVQ